MDWAEVYDALGCLKTSLESRQHSSGMTNIENAPRLGIASIRRRCVQEWDNGGDGGIRTHDRVTPIHTFQACAFDHSATSPHSPWGRTPLAAPLRFRKVQ